MREGAQTPEELETLLEDAFVMRDREALGGLFEHAAVIGHEGHPDARGGEEIERLVAGMWRRDHVYVADTRRVLRAGDMALVVGRGGVHVARRGGGAWRFAISLIALGRSNPEEDR